MLDLDGGEQSSSFTTQIETTEGLTLGKGTEDEVSVTAGELTQIKQSGYSTRPVFYPYHFYSTSLTSGFSYKSLTSDHLQDYSFTGYDPGKQYSVTGHAFVTAFDATVGAIGVIPPINVVADEDGRITLPDSIPSYFIASDSITSAAPEGYIMITEWT